MTEYFFNLFQLYSLHPKQSFLLSQPSTPEHIPTHPSQNRPSQQFGPSHLRSLTPPGQAPTVFELAPVLGASLRVE